MWKPRTRSASERRAAAFILSDNVSFVRFPDDHSSFAWAELKALVARQTVNLSHHFLQDVILRLLSRYRVMGIWERWSCPHAGLPIVWWCSRGWRNSESQCFSGRCYLQRSSIISRVRVFFHFSVLRHLNVLFTCNALVITLLHHIFTEKHRINFFWHFRSHASLVIRTIFSVWSVRIDF